VVWIDASLWERFKRWITKNPSTAFGRWVESRVPVDESRLQSHTETIVEAEAEWTPEDRDIALVWQNEQSLKCPTCGTADWEWDENPDAWHADTWTCEGCRRRDVKADELHKTNQAMNHPAGMHGKQVRMFRTAREE
jgi:hypothetical protein